MQNIPARGELGAKFRKFFIAPDGCKLIISDYSSLEQRIAAHCSQDPVMLQIYRENRDMHAVSASAMFFLDYEEMEKAGGYDRAKEEWADKKAGYDKDLKIWVRNIPEKDDNGKDVKKYFNALTMEPLPTWKETSSFMSIKYMRDEIAKTCAFASNYGGNEVTLGRSLKGYAMNKLKEIYDSYTDTYRVMFAFMNKYGKNAVLRGETVNLAGRKRFYRTGPFEKKPPFLPYRPNKQQIDGMRRQGLNHPIQSLAADIMKLAMLILHIELSNKGLLKIWGPSGQIYGAEKGACPICQVHDELIVQSDDEVAEEVSVLLKYSMEKAEAFYLTTVPASASCSIGTNWSDK